MQTDSLVNWRMILTCATTAFAGNFTVEPRLTSVVRRENMATRNWGQARFCAVKFGETIGSQHQHFARFSAMMNVDRNRLPVANNNVGSLKTPRLLAFIAAFRHSRSLRYSIVGHLRNVSRFQMCLTKYATSTRQMMTGSFGCRVHRPRSSRDINAPSDRARTYVGPAPADVQCGIAIFTRPPSKWGRASTRTQQKAYKNS